MWTVIEWVFGWVPVWAWAALAALALVGAFVWLRSVGVSTAAAIGAVLSLAAAVLSFGAYTRGRSIGRKDEQDAARERARAQEVARREAHEKTDGLSDADARKRLNRWVRDD